MLNFIELALLNGDKVYVNPNQICTFCTMNDETIIQFSDIDNYRW